MTLQMAAMGALTLTSIAGGAIVPTSITGSAHVDGYTTATGFDRDEYNVTRDLSAFGLSVALAETAMAATALSEATADSGTQIVPEGFRAISTNYGRGTIGGQGSNAVGTSRTLMSIRFNAVSDDPIVITGRLDGGVSGFGGRSYFGDGVIVLYNPAGGVALRRNALSTGSTVAELIGDPMLGEWRLEIESVAGATDYGGGGFSGGWVTGSVDISITSVPGPGSATLLAAPLMLGLRRRRRLKD